MSTERLTCPECGSGELSRYAWQVYEVLDWPEFTPAGQFVGGCSDNQATLGTVRTSPFSCMDCGHGFGSLPWLETLTSKRFCPLSPTPEQIDIRDIAAGLSGQGRYAGQMITGYTVAQHSLLCSEYVEEGYELHALLHDAAEAYIGDVPTPVKTLCPALQEVERRIQLAIARKWALGSLEPAPVRWVDKQILAAEIEYLRPMQLTWERIPLLELPLTHIRVMQRAEAEAAFLARFEELTR